MRNTFNLLALTVLAVAVSAQTPTFNSCEAAAGSGTAYACNITPSYMAYQNGWLYRFKADVTNTGSATIAFDGYAPLTIEKIVGGAEVNLVAGDIQAGQWVDIVCVYSGMDGISAGKHMVIVNGVSGGYVFAGNNAGVASIPNGGTEYFGPIMGHIGVASANVYQVQVQIPRAATLHNFYLNIGNSQDASGTLVCTVVAGNGSTTATPVTITVPAGGTTAGNPYTDLTHSYSAAQGESTSLQCVSHATAGTEPLIIFSYEID